MKVKSLSRVRLIATPWTAAHQAPPSMGFSRQEYWSGVPLPSPIVTTNYRYITQCGFTFDQSLLSMATLYPGIAGSVSHFSLAVLRLHGLLLSV